jgi:hypothetical protein
MRIKLFFTIVVLSSCFDDIRAQQSITFTVEPGEEIVEIIPDSVCYSYPFFTDGTVFFKNNRRVTAKLNFNSLFEEIMFIAPGADTMALDNGAAIRYVVMNADTFYFAGTFIKGCGSYGDIKLASKELFVIADVNAIGAMGQKAPSSVTTVKSLLSRSEARQLVRQEVLKIRKETHFYFGDRFNNFTVANRKSLMDFFPAKSKKIKEYMKENSVSFYKKDDLEKMLIALQAE